MREHSIAAYIIPPRVADLLSITTDHNVSSSVARYVWRTVRDQVTADVFTAVIGQVAQGTHQSIDRVDLYTTMY
jgi:hypothetical protein